MISNSDIYDFPEDYGKYNAETKITKGWIIVFHLLILYLSWVFQRSLEAEGIMEGRKYYLGSGHRIGIHGNCLA